MARLILEPLGSPLSDVVSSQDAAERRAALGALNAALGEKLAVVRDGWGPDYADRIHEKGKLTTWERLDLLKDPEADVFCLGSLVNWGRSFVGSKRQAPGAGVVTALTRVHGRYVVVIANDNTVASGAWWPLTPEKIERAQTVALRLRLPVIYLVDCSGLFLPEQSRSFAGPTGAGHIFKKNALLSDAGVPQIAGVFGDCIAGGGYMPIISDRVVMTEGAYMVIAGAALIQGAKALKLTSLDIGGPEVHVHRSGCADLRVPDDVTCVRVLRDEVARLGGSAAEFHRHGAAPEPPRFSPHELDALFPADHRQVYDVHQVLARLVDGSLFHEVLPGVGQEIVVGVARVDGLWTAFAANQLAPRPHPERPGELRPGGILYREGIAKLAAFVRACDADGIPLVWLQDIAGFDIGVEAEDLGLLGYGSSLIYANSTNTTPMITVLLRKASGAGYYAMAGMPYDPVVQLSTPLTRLAVMEGRTLAIATFNSKLDDDFRIATADPVERAAVERGMAETAARIEGDMDPVGSAARMDTDEVVPVAELRRWLEVLVACCYQTSGYRRVKNPRIWSLHDLEVLGGVAGSPGKAVQALAEGGGLLCPTPGTWVPLVTPGAVLRAGMGVGRLRRAGRWCAVLAPPGVVGQVVEVAPPWSNVEHGFLIVTVGAVQAESAEGVDEAMGQGVPVPSPMSGTLFLSPGPGRPNFVAEGDRVEAHQTVALVEVMKTFSPVQCPVAGVITRVVGQAGGAVEAGAPVAWVDPR